MNSYTIFDGAAVLDLTANFGIVVLAALAGVGVAVLVAASPLPTWIPYKPFTCRTCLSGWAAIAATGFLLDCITFLTPGLWLLLALAATGGAHLLLGVADAAAPAPENLPLPEE